MSPIVEKMLVEQISEKLAPADAHAHAGTATKDTIGWLVFKTQHAVIS